MREIKFRVWDKFNEEMILPVDVNGNKKDLSWFYSQYEESIKGGNDLVLMQFTGLKDKNRKEIYEGDLLRIYEKYFGEDLPRESICEVKFNNCYLDAYPMKSYANTLCRFHNECEIIGNIYENPNLLNPNT